MMVGDVLADRYELEELVGSGGMSSVYRAHDRVLERAVALKVLHQPLADDDEYVERFRREARTVAGALAPEHRHRDRPRRARRPAVHRLRVRRRREPEAARRARRAAARSSGRSSSRSRSHAARLRAREGLRPPRRQAAERAAERQRRGEGDRLRDRTLARPSARGDADRHGARHLRLHRAGAGAGQPRRRAHGRVLARSRALRAADGELPFTGDNFVAIAMQHINELAPPVLGAAARRAASARRRGCACAREEAGRSFRDDGGVRPRAAEACLDQARTGEGASETGVLSPPPRMRPARRRPRAPVAAVFVAPAWRSLSPCSPSCSLRPRLSGTAGRRRRHAHSR